MFFCYSWHFILILVFFETGSRGKPDKLARGRPRLTTLPRIFSAVGAVHGFTQGVMIMFTFKLLSSDKSFWTIHYGLFGTIAGDVSECDKNGRVVSKNAVRYPSVWEFVRSKHHEKKGLSIMGSIFFYGHSAAAFISRGEICFFDLGYPNVLKLSFCRISHDGVWVC